MLQSIIGQMDKEFASETVNWDLFLVGAIKRPKPYWYSQIPRLTCSSTERDRMKLPPSEKTVAARREEQKCPSAVGFNFLLRLFRQMSDFLVTFSVFSKKVRSFSRLQVN